MLPITPSFRLDGRRALVTGGSKGLGFAASAALAAAGAEVTLCARNVDDLSAAISAITASGGSARPLVLDVADLTAVETAIAAAAPFHILVNNAGTNRPRTFLDVTVDDFDVIIGLNLRSAFFVAQAVAKRMTQAQIAGSIIHISSQMGHVGGANRTVYCASKAAIEGLTKAMAIDLAHQQIRVNTIGPTFIETPLTQPFFENAAFKASVLQKIKLGRLGRVEDIMGAVVFLASDASALMTGTSMLIDGGWTAD